MSLKCCCSRPVCSARVFSFLCVCSRLLWVSAGLPTDVRGRPTGGAPHSQTPTLPGMVFSGLPTDARGRPTGGAPHSRTPTLPGVGFLKAAKGVKPEEKKKGLGPISTFMEENYKHFNAATVLASAKAYKKLIDEGGKMMISIAGAMSTGEIGISLAEMIRQGCVHAISCTGANLEEDVFNLIAHQLI